MSTIARSRFNIDMADWGCGLVGGAIGARAFSDPTGSGSPIGPAQRIELHISITTRISNRTGFRIFLHPLSLKIASIIAYPPFLESDSISL
jgi:hypothetical protein